MVISKSAKTDANAPARLPRQELLSVISVFSVVFLPRRDVRFF